MLNLFLCIKVLIFIVIICYILDSWGGFMGKTVKRNADYPSGYCRRLSRCRRLISSNMRLYKPCCSHAVIVTLTLSSGVHRQKRLCRR